MGSKKLNRIKRLLLWLLLFLGVLIVVLLVLSPVLTKNYINKNGKDITGRKISIENIKINYFTSTVKILDFKLFEENEKNVFFGFDSLIVDVKPLQLFKNTLNVQQFLIVKPRLNVLQNDSVYNFTNLLNYVDSTYSSSDNVEDTTDESFVLDLNQIEIKSGVLEYTDVQRKHNISMQNISFLIPHIFWGNHEKSKADIHLNLGRGGSISSAFDYDADNGDFEGSVVLSKMELETGLPYLNDYMSFSGMNGTFSSEFQITGNQYDLETINLKGKAQVEDVVLKDESGRPVLKVGRGETVIKELKPFLYQAEIDSLKLDNPYVYIALADSVINFQQMLIEDSDNKNPETETDETMDFQLVLNKFVIRNGLIDFSDQSFNEEFNYELSEVSLDMDTFALQGDWVNLDFNMKLNKRGNLDATLGFNPMEPMNELLLNYIIKDFQLPDVNIYSKYYTGLPILFGGMYYFGNTTITQGKLDSKNELIIRDVEMGRKTGGIYDIPIKLALFILKDINGDIVLDIPVTGDVMDPSTNIGKIVWNTFKGFMFKIVASPFKALGNILGAEPKELEEIAFSYGDTTLLAKQKRSLDLLLKLEELKPELKVEMQYVNDKKLERSDVASMIVQDSFYEKYSKRANFHHKEYLSFLKETTGKDSLLIQDYELLIASPTIIDNEIQKREDLRIRLVNDYLSSENDSTTVVVKSYNREEIQNVGSRPRFLIKYLLAEEAEEKE